jgi:hypothetical protein
MKSILQSLPDITRVYQSAMSYADALTAAIARRGDIEIDGLMFRRRKDINVPTDYVSTGRHEMVYELIGTGKTYRVMIEPVQETHGGKAS